MKLLYKRNEFRDGYGCDRKELHRGRRDREIRSLYERRKSSFRIAWLGQHPNLTGLGLRLRVRVGEG